MMFHVSVIDYDPAEKEEGTNKNPRFQVGTRFVARTYAMRILHPITITIIHLMQIAIQTTQRFIIL